MSARFGPSALHQRDAARNALFDGYERKSRPASQSPARFGAGSGAGGGYGYPGTSSSSTPTSLGGGSGVNGGGDQHSTFRAATPNRKGQYSGAVLDELESQNDREVEGMSARVAMLKDLTMAIGDEIRDSSKLADKMNEGFESTRVRLRGTMTRMLRMAEKTGVGWRAWLGFFAAVILIFWYVWLF